MRNKRTALGFLLSLLLHALILWLIWEEKRDLLLPPPPSMSPHKVKLDLRHFMPSATSHVTATHKTVPKPPNTPVEAVKPPRSSKPLPKETKTKPIRTDKHPSKPTPHTNKKSEKEVPKKENNPLEKRRSKPSKKKKTTKNQVASHKKRRVRPVVTTKVPRKKTYKKTERRHTHRDRLAGLLSKGLHRTYKATPIASSRRIDPNIAKYYGKEFYSFSKQQRAFIRNHLGEIQRITQNTLVRHGYPDVAVRTRQQGTNVVSFYLHPNGDISDLRLLKPMGYEALDENTLEVIRIAYKDYPRPKTKTKIVFYVTYSLSPF